MGFLVWDESAEAKVEESRQPGSRLKTPSLPVWVSSCAGHYGVMFNTNRELLRNYHAERRYTINKTTQCFHNYIHRIHNIYKLSLLLDEMKFSIQCLYRSFY